MYCKGSWMNFGISSLFGITLVIPKFGIIRTGHLQGAEKDSMMQEAASSLKLPDWLKPNGLLIFCSKTYPDLFCQGQMWIMLSLSMCVHASMCVIV